MSVVRLRSLQIVFLAAFPCFLAAQVSPDAADLNHTIALHQAGDYSGAIEGYRRFLRKHPEIAQVRSNLGAALAHEGFYDDAAREYTLALDSDPKNTAAASLPVRLNLALALYKSGRIAEAAANLETVLKAEPANHQAFLLLADCRLRSGENAKVIALVDANAKIETADGATAYVMGLALMRDNQLNRAKLWINRILGEAETAEAHLLMANAKMSVNDAAGARTDLLRAVELNDGLAQAHSDLGLVQMRVGDTAAAEREFRRALELDPNDFDSNLQLVGLLRQDGLVDEARLHLQRALRLRPADLGARFQLASIELSENQTEEARAALESIVKEAPAFVEAHVSLATVYYRLKRKEDGDREREIVRKLNAALQADQPGSRPPVGGQP